MSNTLLFILRAAELETATIPPAIRLAKELSIRETIPEHEAPKAARVTGKVWDKIRPQLAELFHFSAGKVSLQPDNGIDAFDLLLLRSEFEPKKKGKEAKMPTDPRILNMIELGIEVGEAKKLAWHITKTYGEIHLENALKATLAKNPRPLDPKSYIMAVVKNAIGSTGTNTAIVIGLKVKRVKRFIKHANPEAAQTEFLGWEAPEVGENGMARYPEAQRRQVWRMRTGRIDLVAPRAGTPIPNAEQDPGIIIED